MPIWDRLPVAASTRRINYGLADLKGQPVVIFDLSRTVYLDDTAAAMIGQLITTSRARSGRRFVIVGLTGDAADILNGMGLLSWIPKEHFTADLEAAKRIVRPMLLRMRS